MGGIIIILAILIPTLLLANLDKVYVRLMILSTVWLGIIGFIDDYLKIKNTKQKIGIINSLRTMNESDAIIPPSARLPVSPIKI